MEDEFKSCKSCENIFLIAKRYETLQSIIVAYPDKKNMIDNQTTHLRKAIDRYGNFTPQEVKCLLGRVLEAGMLLADSVSTYDKQTEAYTLRGKEEERYLELKSKEKLKAIDYYMELHEKHTEGQKLQKRRRKSAGIRTDEVKRRTLKAQQREHWDNWPNDLSEKKERTMFIHQMVKLGLATDPSTVRANIKEWKTEESN